MNRYNRVLGLVFACAFAALAGTGCAASTGDENTDSSAKSLDSVEPGQADPNGDAPFQSVGGQLNPNPSPKPDPGQQQALPAPIPWHDEELPAPIPWMSKGSN